MIGRSRACPSAHGQRGSAALVRSARCGMRSTRSSRYFSGAEYSAAGPSAFRPFGLRNLYVGINRETQGGRKHHSGLRTRLSWMQGAYQLTREDAVLQKTPFSFDVSVWEFFWRLMAGSRLVFAAPGAHRDPAQVAETVRRQGITTLHFVPSTCRPSWHTKACRVASPSDALFAAARRSPRSCATEHRSSCWKLGWKICMGPPRPRST